MKAAIFCIIGLLGTKAHAAAPLVEGHVRLPSGAPVPGAQVLLFDLSDLRAAPLTTTTDQSGHFTLPLAALAGALPERFELGVNYPNPFNPGSDTLSLLSEPVQQPAQLSHQVKRHREQGHFHALPGSAHLVPDGMDGGRIEVEAHREARPFGQGELVE